MLRERPRVSEPLLDPDLAAQRQSGERKANVCARIVSEVCEPRADWKEVENRAAREQDAGDRRARVRQKDLCRNLACPVLADGRHAGDVRPARVRVGIDQAHGLADSEQHADEQRDLHVISTSRTGRSAG